MRSYKKNPQLGYWVAQQRLKKEYLMTKREDRYKKLEAIGFEWNCGGGGRDTRWLERYDQLVAFKEEHDHCRVPRK